MNSEQKNSQTENQWEDLYRDGLGAPRYPNSYAVRWLFGNFSRQDISQTHILDMGTGMGRHAIMMKQEGFQVTATDHSQTAIDKAQYWATHEGLDIAFSQASAENQPFPDQSFDGILCYGVLYYLAPDKLAQSIREIYRLLKTGGSTFVMIKNDRDIRKIKGESCGPHQYKITGDEEGQPWNNEAGMSLTLLPKSEIEKYFSDFSHIRIEEVTSTLKDSKYLEAAWLIYAQK